MAIYGSVARGEDLPQSDVDVLVIGPVSSIMAQAAFKPVARTYDRKINANAITEKDLVSQLRRRIGILARCADWPADHIEGRSSA